MAEIKVEGKGLWCDKEQLENEIKCFFENRGYLVKKKKLKEKSFSLELEKDTKLVDAVAECNDFLVDMHLSRYAKKLKDVYYSYEDGEQKIDRVNLGNQKEGYENYHWICFTAKDQQFYFPAENPASREELDMKVSCYDRYLKKTGEER